MLRDCRNSSTRPCGWRAATPVKGGYRLSGRFPFSSGVPGAAWNLCGAMLPIGPEGKPVPVPPWVPQDEEDRQLAEYAMRVMALGKDVEQTVARYRQAAGSPKTMTPPKGGVAA